ncbi:MAG: Rpn family recombination-promoting nuclease/putative transposase [Rectinemataceae bacterium]|nr:Rpn family recombination-promoting nuclease/putative transposase [Rectinemataceae bacterium]
MSRRRLVSFDWAMKRLLRSKANFAVLEGFLSELLKDDIVILEVLESESNKDRREQHLTRVDLLVKNSSGTLVIIEVQADRQDDYLQRILFGVSKCIVDHLPEGVEYGQIKKVISVSVVYFDLGVGEDYVYHGSTSFRGMHFHDELKLDDAQRRAYGVETPAGLYPEYYLLKVNNFSDVAKNGLDQWIYFLKNESIEPEFDARGLAEAKERLDVLTLPDLERREYEYWQLELHQRASMVQSHYGRGHREGEEIGIEKGIEKGRAEGRAELVCSMLQNGLSAEQIAKITGLSVEEVLLFVQAGKS